MQQLDFVQSYPPPTELPAMRAGETDGRYMDCTLILAPVGDEFGAIESLSVAVSRRDCLAMSANDLQPAGGAWPTTVDATSRIVTFGWVAPLGSAGVTYLLTLTANPTRDGRVFVRDSFLSVLPLMG